MDYPNDMTKWIKENYPTFNSEQKKQVEELMPELKQEKSVVRNVLQEEYEKGRNDVLQYVTTWTLEELNIIENIIYDVRERKAHYEEIYASKCAEECEQELEFLEKLKLIEIYEA